MDNIVEKNEYVSIQLTDHGLNLILNEEGRDFLSEDKDDYFCDFEEIFESINVNSEWMFHRDLGQKGFGMTSAEGFSVGYHYGDDGEMEGEGDVYYNNEYAIRSFIEGLLLNGYYFFSKA